MAVGKHFSSEEANNYCSSPFHELGSFKEASCRFLGARLRGDPEGGP